MKVAILDYNVGNIRSVMNALSYLGIDSCLTDSTTEIAKSDFLVIPGVGAYAYSMNILNQKNLIPVITEFYKSGRPILGICLGMQLMLDRSKEFGTTEGIGIVQGDVKKLPADMENKRLPHIGWKKISISNNEQNSRFAHLKEFDGKFFYHVHSYYSDATNQNVFSTTDYGDFTYCSGITKNNMLGVQFHPEKSGEVGLEFLRKTIGHF